jgi:hemolysin activation/secretion protein
MVSEFSVDLHSTADQVPVERILSIIEISTYRLSSDDGFFVPPVKDGSAIMEFALSEAPDGAYSLAALQSIQSQMVAALNKSGYYGVIVISDPEQVDPRTGEDLRGGNSELEIDIWISAVVEQRTVAKGKGAEGENPINSSRHKMILEKSPVGGASDTESADESSNGGSLVNKDALDEYLERLNRFPNRRVDAALSAAGAPGEVVLDYVVSETKPWFIYAQVSNTGTESTGEFRERLGGSYYQLLNMDDTLTLDFLTAEFDQANAFTASYQLGILNPQYLSVELFGSYSDFSAENLVIDNSPDFEGETASFGTELRYTPFYFWDHSIKFFAGLSQEQIEVENLLGAIPGEAELLTPYVGLEFSKFKRTHSSHFSLSYETNTNTGGDPVDLAGLGRQNTTDEYDLIQFNVEQTFFLEPLLPGYHAPETGENWRAKTLIHEFAFLARGQFAMDDARLIPQKQIYGGGFFSARGYQESATRGDSGVIASAEYRIHLARLLKPEALLRAEAEDVAEMAAEKEIEKRNFNYRAPNLYGFADWNLMARGFVDYASFSINEKRPDEVEHDLMSVGLGFEFQYKSNLNVRLDYGVILEELETFDETFDGTPIEDAESGDSRLHFLVTFSF